MRTRGTRGGIILSLGPDDTPEALAELIRGHAGLLAGRVMVEITGRVPWTLIDSVRTGVEQAGGEVVEVRPPNSVAAPRGETVILAKTVRSGARVESSGSIVVLGDVNAGAELLANDDIIVLGTLRGLAHAGASGNEHAVIWAQQILSPQLRIGGALAQAGDEAQVANGPEIAHLRDGQIVLRPWT